MPGSDLRAAEEIVDAEIVDLELEAIERCVDTLRTLTQEERTRVIRYLVERFDARI